MTFYIDRILSILCFATAIVYVLQSFGWVAQTEPPGPWMLGFASYIMGRYWWVQSSMPAAAPDTEGKK